MDYQNLCISCFRDKGEGIKCDKCGFREKKRDSSALSAGTMLNGRYLVGRQLKFDNSIIAYKALDTQIDKIVEIQEYFPQKTALRKSGSPEIMVANPVQFNRSIKKITVRVERMSAFSASGNLLNIYGCFEENGTIYTVLEYLEGVLLADYLRKRGGVLSTEAALNVMTAVLNALTELHAQSLIHRAVGMDSIVVTKDKKVKLINFSYIAAALPYKASNTAAVASGSYTPPEKSGQGAFGDIYSAGAVLYHLVTGVAPTDSPDILQSLAAIYPKIPENISLAIMKAMNPDPELRFKSAMDFKSTLIGRKEIVDLEAGLNEEKRKKRKTALITAAVCIVLAAVAAYIILM